MVTAEVKLINSISLAKPDPGCNINRTEDEKYQTIVSNEYVAKFRQGRRDTLNPRDRCYATFTVFGSILRKVLSLVRRFVLICFCDRCMSVEMFQPQ